MDVNLNLYKYFFAVMRQGNVSRAATSLGVSQPTVTYNIQELERALGCQLFVNRRHGLQPYPQAWRLYHQLWPVYHQMLQIINNFIQSPVG